MAENEIKLIRLSQDTVIKPFDSGDCDLNDFLFNDAKLYLRQLLAVTYILEDAKNTIMFYSLSNDVLLLSEAKSKSYFKKITSQLSLNFQKRTLKSYPAVKIGRLATNVNYQSNGYGGDLVKYLKRIFTTDNRTGCVFITVDAYNNVRAIEFYKRSGFKFMKDAAKDDKTRLMFCPLLEEIE